MQVVIVGGNDCMHCQYKEICKRYGCKAKVFTQLKKNMRDQIGTPDLLILFTGTVSHKMINCAVLEAKRKNIPTQRCHSSSASALKEIMERHIGHTA